MKRSLERLETLKNDIAGDIVARKSASFYKRGHRGLVNYNNDMRERSLSTTSYSARSSSRNSKHFDASLKSTQSSFRKNDRLHSTIMQSNYKNYDRISPAFQSMSSSFKNHTHPSASLKSTSTYRDQEALFAASVKKSVDTGQMSKVVFSVYISKFKYFKSIKCSTSRIDFVSFNFMYRTLNRLSSPLTGHNIIGDKRAVIILENL